MSNPPAVTVPGIGILATPTPALGRRAINPLPANDAFGESPPDDLLGDLASPPTACCSPEEPPAPGMAIPVVVGGVATLKLLLGDNADPVGGDEADEEAWWWCAYEGMLDGFVGEEESEGG